MSKRPLPAADFCQLASANLHRGNLAFGYAYGERGETLQVKRFGRPFAPELVVWAEATLALGHVRAPTAGQTDTEGHIHPLASERFYLAHNGLLLNHEAFGEWRLGDGWDLDSHVILGGITKGVAEGQAVVAAIEGVVGQLNGQQSCWLWDREEGAVYLWRVMSPLYWGAAEGAVMWASVATERTPTRAKQGVVYRVDVGEVMVEEVGGFSFYCPYQVRD
ncbi:MAG TPA: hypothetical protein VLL52_12720 [Anaerolineae bacterium]|nr:hypothetical protein [Anaerolineae bacterium]